MSIVTKFMPMGGSVQYFIFSIVLSPVIENATITINGALQAAGIYKKGTTIIWRVSAPGYTAQSGSFDITKDTELTITLESLGKQTLEISAVPENATVIINDVEQKSITVITGTHITWSVSCTGYETQSGELDLNEDTILNITLVKLKFLFSISATPVDSDIYINEVKQSSVIVEYGDTVLWKVSKYGYATQSGENIITKETKLNIELVEVPFYTFSINPTPADSVITINGEKVATVSLPENYSIDWSVEHVGYITQSGNLSLTENTTLEIALEKKDYTFTIVPVPSTCEVKIMDTVQNSVTVKYETEVDYSVSCSGYKTISGKHTVTENTTKNINLEKDSFTYTINPTPEDSIVILDGTEQKSITKEFESVVTWSVSRIGYVTQSGTHEIKAKNETEQITLVKQKYTLTINPNFEDAIVTLNGVIQNSITVDYGTVVNWSVTKEGYTPQSGSETVNDNTTLDIILQKAFFTITIEPTPADSKVLINNIEQKSISQEFQSVIEVNVSHEGYETYNEKITVLADKTIKVALVPKQYTFTINTTPANATVILNGQQVRTIKVNYGTTVNWSVSATGYVSQSGAHTVVSDFTKDVLLSMQYCTYTIIPNPSHATVTINGSVRNTISVPYGTVITWSVAAQYYQTQSGTFAITGNKTDTITLVENRVNVDTSDCTFTGAPCSKYFSRGSNSVYWQIGKVKVSTTTVTATMTKSSGIVTGAAKVTMSYTYSGSAGSGWTYKLRYNTNLKSEVVNGQSATIELAAGEILTSWGMTYSGKQATLSANSSGTCNFSIYKCV